MFFDDTKENQDFVLERISMRLYASQHYFACNFILQDVDFLQDGAWHQPCDVLISHLSKYVRNLEINMRVLPYEYTVIDYRDT